MPWKEVTAMSQRSEFVEHAQRAGVNLSGLCQEYGISRKTAYKWLKRAREQGPAGLVEQSRRPRHSPGQSDASAEGLVLAVRQAHPDWGGRKIRQVLQDQGAERVPAASTITTILHRHHLIASEASQNHQPLQRFEREQPNQLWQMDFKGSFALAAGGSCHPLSILDDHSRFLVGLQACPNQTAATVQSHLTTLFERFGLPEWMLMDNGSAWGFDRTARHTVLTAWLIQLGIQIAHGRPYHPQTQGKVERFHRTLQTELIRRQHWITLADSQTRLDAWRQVYNTQRPHEALGLRTPASCYQPSPRPFPVRLPPVVYEASDVTRKVDPSGKIYFQGRVFQISAGFRGQQVALRPGKEDGVYQVYFCQQAVAHIDLRGVLKC